VRHGKLGRVLLVATLIFLCMGTVSAKTIDFDGNDLQDFTITQNENNCWNVQEQNSNLFLESTCGGNQYVNLRYDGTSFDFGEGEVKSEMRVKAEGSGANSNLRFEYSDSGTLIAHTEWYPDGGQEIWRINDGSTDVFDDSGSQYDAGVFHNQVLYQNQNTLEGTWDGNSHSYSNSVSGTGKLTIDAADYGIDFKIDKIILSGAGWDLNDHPSIDSVSTNPSSWTLGSSVNVSASVSDSDGTVSSVSGSWKYENGTEFDSFSLSNTGGTTWEKLGTGPIDVVEENVTLELTATDDDGATSTYTEEQLISDKDASYTLNQPKNKTYFDYDGKIKVTPANDDGDDIPNENYTCTFYRNNTKVGNATIQEGGNSYSESLRSDLGFYNFVSSCSDDSGLTENKTREYSVKEFEIQSTSTNSPVYETTNQSFTADLKAGDMVETVETSLYWGQKQKDTETISNTGVNTFSQILRHEIPLVNSNQTVKDWNFKINYYYTGFNGNNQSASLNSTTKQQEIWYGYSFGEHKLENGFTQIEASTLNYTANVKDIADTGKGVITAETSYSQTGKTKNLNKKGLNYSNTFNTDLINSDQTFNLATDFNLAFNGDTRTFSSSKNINLDNIKISKSTGEKTLVLKSKDEVNNSLQKSNIELGMQVFNPDQPGKKEFFGFEFSGSDTYELYLQPSYAEIEMTAFQENSLEYQNSDLDFPKRRYYFPNEKLDNQSFDTSLYMLKQSEGQNVQFELLDPDLNPLNQYLIRVERVFPSQNDTKTVAMIKTGSNGKGSTFLDSDEKYVFSVFNTEGDLVQQIGPQTITETLTTLEIQPDVKPSFANLVNKVNFNDVTKNNDSLTVSYVSETERLNNISLNIYRETLFETELVDVDSSSDLQGVLSVSDFNASEEKLFYELQATFGDSTVNLRTGNFGSINDKYGDGGIFISLITFMILTFSGLQRPSASIALGVISIFVLAFTGLMPITQSAFISISALGAVMIWRMSTKS